MMGYLFGSTAPATQEPDVEAQLIPKITEGVEKMEIVGEGAVAVAPAPPPAPVTSEGAGMRNRKGGEIPEWTDVTAEQDKDDDAEVVTGLIQEDETKEETDSGPDDNATLAELVVHRSKKAKSYLVSLEEEMRTNAHEHMEKELRGWLKDKVNTGPRYKCQYRGFLYYDTFGYEKFNRILGAVADDICWKINAEIAATGDECCLTRGSVSGYDVQFEVKFT